MKICSDKAPLKDREWSVTKCYKRGVKAGFVAGIKKAQKDAQALMTPQPTPSPTLIPQQQFNIPEPTQVKKKINASVLKNVLKKDLYKQFLTEIKQGGKPQETYDKYGIRELKILATIMINNLDLPMNARSNLNTIINDTRIQGNKKTIKDLMDSTINSLL